MTTTDTKTCQKCEITKEFHYFEKDKSVKDGYRNKCKECVKIELKEKQAKFLSENTHKKCTGNYGCGQTKILNEFGKDPSKATGLESLCKECKLKRKKERNSSDNFKKKQKEFEKNNTHQICIKCNKELPLYNFRKRSEHTTGYDSVCKDCHLQKEHSQEYKQYLKQKQEEYRKNNTHKICTGCGKNQPLKFYDIDNHSSIGIREECKDCTKSRREKRKLSYTQESQKEYRNKFPTKKCTGCNEVKKRDTNDFNKNAGREDGLNDYCKICQRKVISNYRKTPEAKLKAATYKRNKKDTDIQFKIRCNVSTMICNRLKSRLASKEGKSTFDILPYTIEDLMDHLENQFQDGMSWNNYGVGEDKWEIDHMTPDSWFNYESTDDVNFLKSWALENLQPMWCFDNRSKNNRFASNIEELEVN